MLRVDLVAPVTGYLFSALKQQHSELKLSLKAWEMAIVLGCKGASMKLSQGAHGSKGGL